MIEKFRRKTAGLQASLSQTPGMGVFLQFLVVTLVLIHANTFAIQHVEGDELVYLGLSRTMDWLSRGYSTADLPVLNEFPARIYRAPLFHHPPLFPYLLKVFALFGDPVFLGLAFNLGIHIGIVVMLWALIPGAGGVLAAAIAAVCPVLTFSTIKLHIDGLAGFLCLASMFALVAARRSNRTGRWILAAVVAGLFANTKLTALGVLAAPVLVALLDLRRVSFRAWAGTRGVFLLVLLAIASPHVIRWLVQYGPLWPGTMLVHERPANDFLKMIMSRGRVWSATTLFLLSPFAGLVFLPGTWNGVRRSPHLGDSWWVVPLYALTSFLMIALFEFSSERYWALFLPVFYAAVGFWFNSWWPERRMGSLVASVFLFSILMMAFSSLFNASLRPQFDIVIPSLEVMVPGAARGF